MSLQRRKRVEMVSGISVETKYPTYVDGKKVSPKDYYVNADGKDKKSLVDKTKGFVQKLQDSGVVDAARTIYDASQGKGKQSDSTITPPTVVTVAPPPEKKKMSTTTKVLIGAAVVGVIAYLIYQSKHQSKGKK